MKSLFYLTKEELEERGLTKEESEKLASFISDAKKGVLNFSYKNNPSSSRNNQRFRNQGSSKRTYWRIWAGILGGYLWNWRYSRRYSSFWYKFSTRSENLVLRYWATINSFFHVRKSYFLGVGGWWRWVKFHFVELPKSMICQLNS